MSKASMTSDLFAGDTHASLSASLDNGVAQKMTDISGLKCLGLSKNSGPIGLLEKMCLATSQWASTKCSLTWRTQATPQGRLLFQLVPLTLHIEETESGQSQTMWMTPRASDAKGHSMTRTQPHHPKAQLREQVFWPTPTQDTANRMKTYAQGAMPLSFAVKLWGTPRASHGMAFKMSSVKKSLKRLKGKPPSNLEDQMCELMGDHADSENGSLNPAWVEWLMGFPIGHTDLNS